MAKTHADASASDDPLAAFLRERDAFRAAIRADWIARNGVRFVGCTRMMRGRDWDVVEAFYGPPVTDELWLATHTDDLAHAQRFAVLHGLDLQVSPDRLESWGPQSERTLAVCVPRGWTVRWRDGNGIEERVRAQLRANQGWPP